MSGILILQLTRKIDNSYAYVCYVWGNSGTFKDSWRKIEHSIYTRKLL